MGLAKTVATRFPDWGPEFATLMVGLYFSSIHPLHCGFLHFQQNLLALALTIIKVSHRAVSRSSDCFLAQKYILKLVLQISNADEINWIFVQVAIILLNLCVGPPLFRSAIFAAGEARSQNASELQPLPKSDGSPRSPLPL